MRHLSPVALLALVLAGCQCPFARHGGGGIQQPQMTPKGTYQAPTAPALGSATAAPWSGTTIEAAVDKMPREGEVKTLTGEVIDVSCYLQLGKHGAKHKDCGQKCARNGNPIGLLLENGTVVLLMAEEHHPRRDGQTGSLREALIERMADVVSVTGTFTTLNGMKALYVSGFAK